jgi:hypothetical protein
MAPLLGGGSDVALQGAQLGGAERVEGLADGLGWRFAQQLQNLRRSLGMLAGQPGSGPLGGVVIGGWAPVEASDLPPQAP